MDGISMQILVGSEKKKELLPEIYTIFSSSLTQRTGERSVRFAMEQNTQKHLVLYVYA